MSTKKHEQITLFKTNLYGKKLEIDNKKIIKYINKIDRETVIVPNQSNYGGWHSHFYFEPFPSCVEQLNLQINSFMKETIFKDFDVRGDLCVHNSWFLINNKNNFNKPRKRPPYTFTGVYLVKGSSNSGDIIFNNQAEMNNYAVDYKNFNEYNSKEFTLKLDVGCVYIWPAWVETLITPNQSNSEKILYGFNI